ncbi:MAG: acylphosphatase [Candidatus Heimdallarchaeota archaeon]|nr:acylphosphatase [Candidatus Heimdallarchaeota archaeon]
MKSNEKTIMHATINVYGHVQGVSFRAYTRRKAQELDLKGYVKNLRDGTVLIEVEGPKDKIKQLYEWAKTSGSPASEVSGADISWSAQLKNYKIFQIELF